MGNTKLTWRSICSAFGLVSLLVWSGGATSVEASGTYGWCSEECDSESDCAMECENDGGGTITCGEYHDGAAEGWCDGDTCDNQCAPTSGPGEACWLEGVLSDCGTYGVAAYCGDDICENISNDEDCVSCEADCGECPDPRPCGDYICDPGETYVTCPTDCDDPGPQGFCGDGTCSEADDEDPESCALDCIMPNERCEDDFDCGAGYSCIAGGQPFGGQCVLFEQLINLSPCLNGQCPAGFVCRQIEWEPDPPDPAHINRCIWFWEAYTR